MNSTWGAVYPRSPSSLTKKKSTVVQWYKYYKYPAKTPWDESCGVTEGRGFKGGFVVGLAGWLGGLFNFFFFFFFFFLAGLVVGRDEDEDEDANEELCVKELLRGRVQ